MKLILASKSPQRQKLLKEISVLQSRFEGFDVVPAGIDESQNPAEAAQDYVERLAHQKALTVKQKLLSEDDETYILAADTAVCLQKKILGKPKDKNEARFFLSELSGKEHVVVTGYCILCPQRSIDVVGHVSTQVRFYSLSQAQIDNYLNTPEPYDKAGAYAIQGQAKDFVKSIEGSLTNVIGLPCEKIQEIFTELTHKNKNDAIISK